MSDRQERSASVPPVLVLGIGNQLLGDDGLGLALLDGLRASFADDPRVELVDGGTQGILLVGQLEQRRSLLLLDAVRRSAAPGTVHLVRDADRIAAVRGFDAHGGNASELLASARLLGVIPERIVLVGIEPAEIRTRLGLSPPVRAALPAANTLARRQLLHLLSRLRPHETLPCTS